MRGKKIRIKQVIKVIPLKKGVEVLDLRTAPVDILKG